MATWPCPCVKHQMFVRRIRSFLILFYLPGATYEYARSKSVILIRFRFWIHFIPAIETSSLLKCTRKPPRNRCSSTLLLRLWLLRLYRESFRTSFYWILNRGNGFRFQPVKKLEKVLERVYGRASLVVLEELRAGVGLEVFGRITFLFGGRASGSTVGLIRHCVFSLCSFAWRCGS
jgi:hypothetical protein